MAESARDFESLIESYGDWPHAIAYAAAIIYVVEHADGELQRAAETILSAARDPDLTKPFGDDWRTKTVALFALVEDVEAWL